MRGEKSVALDDRKYIFGKPVLVKNAAQRKREEGLDGNLDDKARLLSVGLGFKFSYGTSNLGLYC